MKATKTFAMIPAAIATLFMAAIAFAADKPNFSGDWKLNIDKSTFGPLPPPNSATRKIDHQDPSLTVTSAESGAMGDQNVTIKCTTDGKETSNDVMGNPMKVTANWDGSMLVVDEKLDFQGNSIAIKDKWTLSDDGKTLTTASHITSPQGEFDTTRVYEKQ